VRFLVIAALIVILAIVYLAVVLRLPSARSLLRTALRIGWLWVAMIVILGALQAYRQWG
jgi:hypothetical protein